MKMKNWEIDMNVIIFIAIVYAALTGEIDYKIGIIFLLVLNFSKMIEDYFCSWNNINFDDFDEGDE